MLADFLGIISPVLFERLHMLKHAVDKAFSVTKKPSMANQYNHKELEKKWLKSWSDQDLYKTPEITTESKKKYILETFPYPSGYAMHVGHIKGYVGSDVTARFARMKGFSVLYPIGWDAFGLPAENYAIKTGIHPRPNTDEVIKVSTDQLTQVGLSYDWSREIATHRPDYYKWTQWLFTLLYKRGLAYKKEALVNWDPIDQTVLANEQVLADGTAERSGAKVEQRLLSQWFFKITDYAERLLHELDELDWPESTKLMQRNWIGKSEGAEIDFSVLDSDNTIRIFTTAHDTMFGSTFLVIAPEHPLIDNLTTTEQFDEVSEYKEKSKQKSQFERTEMNKDKSGVFTGSYVVNPLNGAKIPIWVADYVIMNYGTGAVMGVPGEDERDFEFATKYDLPIIYTNNTNAFLSYSQEIKPNLAKYSLINSGEFDNLNYFEARAEILQKLIDLKVGKAKITYRLRDWLVSRQRYWGSPIPVIYDKNGNESLVPDSDLPVVLPEDVNFLPTGRSPLLDHIGFHESAQKYGTGTRREVDTMDTFVCSSWYFFRYCSPKNDVSFSNVDEMKKWMPVDQYIIGSEHSTMHLLYARFFTKVLFDAGYIDFNEPFVKVRHQGLVRGEDGRKMSKRWGNVVNPNDIIAEYGADTLRVYEMFMGPFEDGIAWSSTTVKGVKRFLDKVWKLQDSISDTSVFNTKIENQLHRLIKKVGEDIEKMSFNTCVSEFMKFVNFVEESGGLTKSQFGRFLLVLAPFAPFITEEIWFNLGNQLTIHRQEFPEFVEKYLVDEISKIVVQINGKVRTSFEIQTDETEEAVIDTARVTAQKWLEGKTIKFTKVIPNKLVSFVVE